MAVKFEWWKEGAYFYWCLKDEYGAIVALSPKLNYEYDVFHGINAVKHLAPGADVVSIDTDPNKGG